MAIDDFPGNTEAADVAYLAKMADDAVAVSNIIIHDDGREFIAKRNDFTLEQLTPPNKAKVYLPQLVAQHVKLTDAASLSHYMNRFKNADSLLFAHIASNVIVGAIDYHVRPPQNVQDRPTEGGVPASADASARLVKHQATLGLAFAKEWETWTRSSEKLMKHVEFASFLEENAIDVAIPSGADLLELCRDLQVRQNAHFSSSIRMGDRVSLTFSKDEDATTKDSMELPVEFTLSIPVYFNEPNVMVRCLTRRKIDDGELLLGYKMVRTENIRQAEFQRIVNEIEADTDLDAVYGTQS